MFQAGQRELWKLKPLCRFAYVDMAMGSVIEQAIADRIRRLVLSYDSMCKYVKYLIHRLCRIHPALITEADLERVELECLIPKFHLGGHKADCADTFSFNYAKNVGRMSGELVETPWATLNGLQYSTREMGWGNRRDMLTDHMNFWNWRKKIGMGE